MFSTHVLVAAALLACSVPARAQACPSVTTTTACYAGITGPPAMVTLALSQLAQLGLLLPSGTPLPINTTTNQPCVSATVTCTTLQTLAPVITNQVCPSTLSLTAYLPIPNTTQAVRPAPRPPGRLARRALTSSSRRALSLVRSA